MFQLQSWIELNYWAVLLNIHLFMTWFLENTMCEIVLMLVLSISHFWHLQLLTAQSYGLPVMLVAIMLNWLLQYPSGPEQPLKSNNGILVLYGSLQIWPQCVSSNLDPLLSRLKMEEACFRLWRLHRMQWQFLPPSLMMCSYHLLLSCMNVAIQENISFVLMLKTHLRKKDKLKMVRMWVRKKSWDDLKCVLLHKLQ